MAERKGLERGFEYTLQLFKQPLRFHMTLQTIYTILKDQPMKSSDNNQQNQVQAPEIKFLKNKIEPFIKEYQFQVNFNRFLGIVFSITSIGLSLGVTLAGINNNAHLAAGLGAASAAVQTAFGIFPLEKRVWFYRSSVAEAEKIKSFLEYKADYSIDRIVDDFETLRTTTLIQEPLNSIPDSFSPNTAIDKQLNNSRTDARVTE